MFASVRTRSRRSYPSTTAKKSLRVYLVMWLIYSTYVTLAAVVTEENPTLAILHMHKFSLIREKSGFLPKGKVSRTVHSFLSPRWKRAKGFVTVCHVGLLSRTMVLPDCFKSAPISFTIYLCYFLYTIQMYVITSKRSSQSYDL